MTRSNYLPVALIAIGLFCVLMIPAAALAQELMTNQSVVDMVKSGVSEKEIVAKINTSRSSKFDLSPGAVTQLKLAGASNAIIRALEQKTNNNISPKPDGTPQTPGPNPVPTPGIGRVCEGCVRYRVIVTRFVVNNATSDSPVSRDGFGDEAFVAGNFVEMTSNKALIGSPGSKKSVIYGDTDGRPVGVGLIPQLEHYPRYWTMRAGSGHPTGGLINGDQYPARGTAPSDPSDASPAMRGRFIPMTLWEGDLRVGSAPNGVLILATIWESDNVDDVWNTWNRQAGTYLSNFARHSSGYVSGTTARPIMLQVDNVLTVVPQRRDYDRPVGMDGQPFDPLAASPESATFVPAAMFLTAEKADEAVTYCRTHGDYKIDYRDGRLFGPGNYTLFVRVERVR